MELHQLRYFVTVAELGNFTRAAEKCFVAQPSLSQQIIKLEKELGRPLFERSARRVRLTDAGRSLYEQAASILAAVDDAKRSLREEADSGQGRVAVGAIPTIAPYVLPGLLKRFLKCFPRAEVTIHENLTEHTIHGCLEGELDVGLVALPVEDERLHVEPLSTEELLLVMAAGHPLAKKRRITMRDVSTQPFVLLNETHCLGQQIVGFCKQNSCLPAVSCHSAQLFTVQELVAQGHGVSLIPEMAAAMDTGSRRIYRSLSGTRPTRTLAMIWHKHRYHSPLVEEFLGALRASGGRRERGRAVP